MKLLHCNAPLDGSALSCTAGADRQRYGTRASPLDSTTFRDGSARGASCSALLSGGLRLGNNQSISQVKLRAVKEMAVAAVPGTRIEISAKSGKAGFQASDH